MTHTHYVKAGCRCGAVQWRAPAPEASAKCDCGYCRHNNAEWACCDSNEFETLKILGSVIGLQFDRFSPRHYHCKQCGTPLWTWTPDTKRGDTSVRAYDYENPILNWNITLVVAEEPEVVPVLERVA